MTIKSINSPTDFTKSRQEVKARLEKIDNPRLSAAFALRVASSVLPMLTDQAGEKGFLWYWGKAEREKHLLSIFRALQTGWAIMLSNPALITADISDVRAAAATAAADAAGAAYAVVYAAAAAANADATTNAAYAAAYAVAARNKAFRHYAVSAVPNRFIVDELDRLPVDFDAHAYLAASCTLAHELKPLQERERVSYTASL